MSTYKELHGRSIVPASSNPAASGDAGKIFYNSTDNVFRSIVSGEAFSSSAPVSTARYSLAFGGPQTANFVATGAPGDPTSTEEFNGTGWAAGGAVNSGRDGSVGAGTIPAGLIMGGASPGYTGKTEEYNGTSWSEQTDLSQARGYANGAGIQTAAWLSGGRQGPPYSNPDATEEYDGTNWTSGGALATNTRTGSFSGPQTAAWIVGGVGPDETTIRSIYQEYDGSTWTNGPSNPTAIRNGGGSGTQTLAIAFGVQTPPAPNGVTTVFKYDGTTWATSPATLATARRSVQNGMGPSGSTAICVAGRNPSASSLTEEYNVTSDTITAAAFASGGNLSTGRYGLGSAGTQTAALAIGGEGPPEAKTEEYDGSSWTAGGNLSTGRYYVGGAGLQNAGLAVGGRTPGSFAVTDTEHYGGTSWTSGGALPGAANGKHTSGTQTAGLAWGGISSPGGSSLTVTDEYDGSNWTSGGTLPSGVRYGVGTGTQTAALNAGGDTPGLTLYYNGTSWASQAPQVMLPQSKSPLGFFAGGFGTQTASVVAGGRDSPGANKAVTSQQWDGSAWSTAPNLSTARGYGGVGPVGSTTAGAVFGGQGDAPPYANITATEEFTGETTSVNVKTITTS